MRVALVAFFSEAHKTKRGRAYLGLVQWLCALSPLAVIALKNHLVSGLVIHFVQDIK
jgi:hypothetical protein